MSLRLRRSTRAKPAAKFNVGDTIEFKRRSKTGEGRLAFRLTEGESPNPLWLVTFDGTNVKDEEIYEKHFTKLIKKGKPKEKVPRKRRGGRRAASTRGSAAAKPDESKEIEQENEEKKTGDEKNNSTSSSDPEAGNGGTRGGRRRGSSGRSSGVSEEKEDDGAKVDSGAMSDSSAPPQKRDSSTLAEARAARSLRRQAKIDEGVPTGPARKGGIKRGPPGSASAQDPSKRFQKATSDEEVVKVKLNTGTLYLYKGLNRRAVFVRRL